MSEEDPWVTEFKKTKTFTVLVAVTAFLIMFTGTVLIGVGVWAAGDWLRLW